MARIYEEALFPGERGLGPVQGGGCYSNPGVQGQQSYKLSLWRQEGAPEPEWDEVLVFWLAWDEGVSGGCDG